MVKLFRVNFGKKSSSTANRQDNTSNSNSNKKKRRLSPNNNSNIPQVALTPEVIRERYPMYQYALDEFAQTVAPGTSNADGMEMYQDDGNYNGVITGISSSSHNSFSYDEQQQQQMSRIRKLNNDIVSTSTGGQLPPPVIGASQPSASWSTASNDEHVSNTGTAITHSNLAGVPVASPPPTMTTNATVQQESLSSQQQQEPRPQQKASSESYYHTLQQPFQQQQNQRGLSQQQLRQQPYLNLGKMDSALSSDSSTAHTNHHYYAAQSAPRIHPGSIRGRGSPLPDHVISDRGGQPGPGPAFSSDVECNYSGSNKSTLITQFQAFRSPFENDMPDATYEEVYGEAYTGGRLKYIYPAGYQSMRPRACPWKLSIVVCLLFTWLSVFIVGHCSDQVENEYDGENNNGYSYNDGDGEANNNNTMDSDPIDERWCGSRPLYLMWVVSMLITGFSASYCSIIGYIKLRDFAVANSRSQPPGVVEGKSDYYVRITNDAYPPGGNAFRRTHSTPESTSSTVTSPSYYRPSIYQSDGMPQFWGSHIYRPTQAAVAITNR